MVMNTMPQGLHHTCTCDGIRAENNYYL